MTVSSFQNGNNWIGIRQVSKMEAVVNRGIRGLVTEAIEIYNLDMILSVGYRVNSKRAIAFRQWSTKVLKQYLLNGYAVNERIRAEKFDELSQLVKVMGRAIQHQELITEGESLSVQRGRRLYLCPRHPRPLRLSRALNRKHYRQRTIPCYL